MLFGWEKDAFGENYAASLYTVIEMRGHSIGDSCLPSLGEYPSPDSLKKLLTIRQCPKLLYDYLGEHRKY